MEIPFIQKSSLLLLSPPPGGSLTMNRRFSFAHPPLCQWVLGVVGLSVGECLDVGPLFVVLRQVTYSQEGLQHQGSTDFPPCSIYSGIYHRYSDNIPYNCPLTNFSPLPTLYLNCFKNYIY